MKKEITTMCKDGKMVYEMPSLEQYLSSGLSIWEVIRRYINALRKYGKATNNSLELYHAVALEKYLGIVTNCKFIQSIQLDLQQKFIDEVGTNKDFSFAVRGRIKSLIRFENKFNDYVQSFVLSYYDENQSFPSVTQIKAHLDRFRDPIAFRLILQSRNHDEDMAVEKLISIANKIPEYFSDDSMDPNSKGGYKIIPAKQLIQTNSNNPSLLDESVRKYYKDYVSNPKEFGFQAFVIVMKHNMSGHKFELQMETFEMLKHNEHSDKSHHKNYEKVQTRRRLEAQLPKGKTNKYFELAHKRLVRLAELDLTTIDVDMFHAFTQDDVEDLCGLLYGRQASPREFL
jgi:hypothetical protein